MQLVIYGKEDIATLTKYAKDMFSAIKNKQATRPSFAPNTSFPDLYNGKIVYYIPVADRNSVSIYWQVPPLIDLYREQVSLCSCALMGRHCVIILEIVLYITVIVETP